MVRALLAEIYKLRRARLTWIAALVLLAAPALAATIVAAMSDPVRGEALGLTPELAETFGEPGWSMMFEAVSEILAGGFGLILYPILAASLFVREYASGTMKVMLTLPVRRSALVVSKFIVLAGWIALLTAYLYAMSVGLLVLLVGMGPPSMAEAAHGAVLYAQVALLIYLGLSVPSLLATFGKGYLPPMVFVGMTAVLSVALANSVVAPYIVWMMPGAHTAATSIGEASPIGPLQWVLAVGTFAVGALATWVRVRFFDAPR